MCQVDAAPQKHAPHLDCLICNTLLALTVLYVPGSCLICAMFLSSQMDAAPQRYAPRADRCARHGAVYLQAKAKIWP